MARKTAAEKKAEEEQQLENVRREAFCQYYAQNRETFGNATESYALAYSIDLDSLSRVNETETVEPNEEDADPYERFIPGTSPYSKQYNICSAAGSRLLRNAKVQQRVQVLLAELLKDEIVDGELARVIMQNGKLEPKVSAIREYNKLRGRIIDKTQQIGRLPFGESDLSVLIDALPQERQDYFYGIIGDLIKEAELRRSPAAPQGGGTGKA